jgi:hypothetical protein
VNTGLISAAVERVLVSDIKGSRLELLVYAALSYWCMRL